MNEKKMALFIAEQRKEKGMTQRELAEQLGVTDKAVSKWERALSCPDISLLTPLSELLGVTVSELLSGARENSIVPAVDTGAQTALQYASVVSSSKEKNRRGLATLIFSAALFVGCIVCFICNLAISHRLTWSLYPLCSSALAWVVAVPVVLGGRRGLPLSLGMLTLGFLPFLYALHTIVGTAPLIFPMGARIGLISLVFLWIVYFLATKAPWRRHTIAAVILLLTAPLSLFINSIVARYVSGSGPTIWNVLSAVIVVAVAIFVFTSGYLTKQKSE